VLTVVPILSAVVPVLAFRTTAVPALGGVLVWGPVLGLQESTMRAAVADLVPTARRGAAYGIFAAGFGAATFAGGAIAGTLYDRSTTALDLTVATAQAAAFGRRPTRTLTCYHRSVLPTRIPLAQ
jgi:MFS family permease